MVRSFAFTTKGELYARNIEPFLMPTLLSDTKLFLWVDLEQPTTEEVRFFLEEVFHFHPLSIEDCVVEHPTPKVEEYTPKEGDLFEPYIFIIMQAVDYMVENELIVSKNLNFFLGKNFLVTYHPQHCQPVEMIVERCLRGDFFPARTPDRVAYLLLDAVVEGYRPVLRKISDKMADIEEAVMNESENEKDISHRVLKLRKNISHVIRIVVPQLEMLWRFANGEFHLIRPKMAPYFRDVYDALQNIYQQAQLYSESLTHLLQIYLNISSNRVSDVVKILTAITVITMPAMVIGTWYGMNFQYMPELDLPFAYPVVVIITLILTIVITIYFRRKRWL